MGDKNLIAMSDKLLNHITINAAAIFQPTVRLFPPGFSKSEEVEPDDYEGLTELVEDLSDRIQMVQAKLEKVRTIPGAEVFVNNIGNIKFATNEDIDRLKSSLESLRKHIVTFNQDYEYGMGKKLNKGQTMKEQSRLGEVVEAAYTLRKEFE